VVLRHLALSYQITAHHSSEFRHSCRSRRICSFVVCLFARAIGPGGTPKIARLVARIAPAQILWEFDGYGCFGGPRKCALRSDLWGYYYGRVSLNYAPCS
jgi:hypothetical protein